MKACDATAVWISGRQSRQPCPTLRRVPPPGALCPAWCWQAVMSVDAERARLEAEAEALAEQQGEEVEARLEDIYER